MVHSWFRFFFAPISHWIKNIYIYLFEMYCVVVVTQGQAHQNFLSHRSSFNRSLQQNLFLELEYSCVFAVCVFYLFRSHLQNGRSAYTSTIYSYHIWKCKCAFVSKQNLIENGWRDTIRCSIGHGIVEIENCETRSS